MWLSASAEDAVPGPALDIAGVFGHLGLEGEVLCQGKTRQPLGRGVKPQ